jgi:hypothetical protein
MGMAGAITELFIVNAAATLTSNGKHMRWSLQFPNTSGTKTFADDWICDNDFILQGGVTITGFSVTVGGSFSGFNGGQAAGGSTNIIMNGTGNWSAVGVGTCLSNLTINTAGTVTVSGQVGFGASGKTLTYTAGTVVTTGSTLLLYNGAILNTAGITWNNVTFSVVGPPVITINSLFLVNGSMSFGNGGSATFAGTSGFETNTFSSATTNVGSTIILAAGVTYKVDTSFFVEAESTSHFKLKSDTPGTRAIFTLKNGATNFVAFGNATDIDSSLGRTIWTYAGVLSNTLNWNTFTDIATTTAGATFLG